MNTHCRICGICRPVKLIKQHFRNILEYMHTSSLTLEGQSMHVCYRCTKKLKPIHKRQYGRRNDGRPPLKIINIVPWNYCENCPLNMGELKTACQIQRNHTCVSKEVKTGSKRRLKSPKAALKTQIKFAKAAPKTDRVRAGPKRNLKNIISEMELIMDQLDEYMHQPTTFESISFQICEKCPKKETTPCIERLIWPQCKKQLDIECELHTVMDQLELMMNTLELLMS